MVSGPSLVVRCQTTDYGQRTTDNSACSAVWPAHVPRAHGVEGSNPSTLTCFAQVAERQLPQPVELMTCNGLRGFESLPAHSFACTAMTRRKFQWRNAGLQIRKRQVRSLSGVLVRHGGCSSNGQSAGL